MSSNRQPFAKKSFGQNFLVDADYIERIVAAVGAVEGETVIEIGPGRGALTMPLLAEGIRVVAIELERDMISALKASIGERADFALIEADALKIDFGALADEFNEGRPLKLVANLPYYISTAILQKLIEERAAFSSMVLMFQREVVERITAPVGHKERGFLTVMTESYLEAEKLFDVPPSAFRPPPKVWSAITRLITKPQSGTGQDGTAQSDTLQGGEPIFRRLVSEGFLQKRKTILNNLKASGLIRSRGVDAAALLETAEINPQRRPETLTVEEWRRLADNVGSKTAK